jgi:hypothetical protein
MTTAETFVYLMREQHDVAMLSSIGSAVELNTYLPTYL